MNYPSLNNALPSLAELLQHNKIAILQAPPGTGKTTQVPIALLASLGASFGKIVMLEPRRLAAVSAANWMARSLGEKVGETVGYSIRFDSRTSPRTRIEVVTEGILTRRIQTDPGLDGVSLVIFDEYHERSIHADLALALCLDVRRELRDDLKILIMSATLDTTPLASLLGGAPVLQVEGKAYPVEERYDGGSGVLTGRITAAVTTALRETSGDILVFLPGGPEIRASAGALREALRSEENRISLHPLYGDLPFDEQQTAIMPSPDRRKIVLATNIAETSLTIEGVRIVIDSGLTRTIHHDQASGMNRLVTTAISRASAEQRKGRAGRVGPGVCYRLYSRHELHGMPQFSRPEILLADLSQLALELVVWGVKEPASLAWLDPPPPAAWDAALNLLRRLGAVDATGAATPAGRAMTRLPLHPRLSRLLVRAQELGCVPLAVDLAALLSERDVFRRSPDERMRPESDVAERLDALRRWRGGSDMAGNIDAAALRSVDRTARQLRRLLGATAPETAVPDEEIVAHLLLAAFPDRLCKRREGTANRYLHAQGRGMRISPDSRLVNSVYLIAVSVDAGASAEGFIHIAAPVTEQVIRTECGGRIASVRQVAWDRAGDRVRAFREERLDALVIANEQVTATDEEAAHLLCDAIRTSPGMLPFTDEVRQFLARESLLRKAFPEENWPDLSEHLLLQKPEEWLLPWLPGIRSLRDLRNLNLLPVLASLLSHEQRRLLEVRAPQAISVPSGSRVRIDYAAGEVPVLAVKLQELFGLAETPAIASGRITLLLHLLSPARRPVQITRDLRGFWNTVYPEVKKDLKGRYPKHPWPDDPWNAAPTKRTNPRKN